MFNNNQTSRNEVNVNTGIETFWSPIASLSIGCYNDKISLRWLPAIGKDERGYTRYNSEARVSTCVSHTKVSALLQQYDKNLKSMIENSEDPGEDGKSVMVPINAKSGMAGLFIEYKRDEDGKPGVYLTFARNLTEVGADPSNIIRYRFNELTVMKNMKPETGGGDQVEVLAEFDYVIAILRAHILMTGVNSHATRYSDAFSKGRSGFGASSNNSMPDAGANGFADMLPPDADGLSVFS